MDKNNINHSLEKVEKLVELQKFSDAIEILESLLNSNPGSNKIKRRLIDTLFKYGNYLSDDYVGEYESAREIYNQIVKLDPQNYRGFYNIGLACFSLNRDDEALNAYQKALEINPEYKYCYYNIGLLHEEAERLEEALKMYDKAIQLDENFTYARQARNIIREKLDKQKKEEPIDSEKLNSSSEEAKINKIRKLKSLFKMGKKIKTEMIQSLLGLDKAKLMDLILFLGEKYNFKLDGDYLLVNEKMLPELLDSMESFQGFF